MTKISILELKYYKILPRIMLLLKSQFTKIFLGLFSS